MKSKITLIVSTFILTGCANCGFLNSSTPCQAQLAAGMIVAAPVLLPYYFIKQAKSDSDNENEKKRMLSGVLAGNVDDSFQCLFECYAKEEAERLIASETIIKAYEMDKVTSGKEQAGLMLAHIWRAYSFSETDPIKNEENLLLAVQAASVPKMWESVNADYKISHIPKNDSYFKDLARNIFGQIIMIRQEKFAKKMNNPSLAFSCDTTGLTEMIKLSGFGNPQRVIENECEWAGLRWKEKMAKAK